MSNPNVGICEVKVMALENLNPADYNPRFITDASREALKKSIEKFGITVPILWNRQTGNIVGGHQRYFILKEMGISETTVAICDLSMGEEKALNVALNSSYLTGEFIPEKAQLLIKEVKSDFPEIHDDLKFDILSEELKTDWDSNINLGGINPSNEQSMDTIKIQCMPDVKETVRTTIQEALTEKGFSDVVIS